MDLIRQARRITTEPQYTKWTAPLQLLADAALCALVILKVSCTWPPLLSHRPENSTTILQAKD